MSMGIRLTLLIALGLLALGCASQDPMPQTEDPVEVDEPVLDVPIWFATADGSRFESGELATLPTGGPPAGRLIPHSANPDVVLYVTRDASVPGPDNNWGGPIDPSDPLVISRPLEGPATYRLVAESDGVISDSFVLNVNWRHEESPTLGAPSFSVDGRPVSGAVRIPVSDGTEAAGRLEISCDYSAATLYITRDGTAPSAQNSWRSQTCDATYIWSPEPTAADYRVAAVWQGAVSPVASLTVEWVSP